MNKTALKQLGHKLTSY